MAFDPTQLSALSYCNGFTLWHYRSPDSSSTLDTKGYFNKAFGILRRGDLIIGHASEGNTSATVNVGLFVVSNDQKDKVDATNFFSFGASNTD